AEYKRREDGPAGNMEGMGALISQRSRRPTIMSTLPDSPARAAGLKSGDILLDVDGKSVATLPLERIVNMVRGEPGTIVKLRVSRQGRPTPLELSIARARVDAPDVSWRMLPGRPIAQIAIESFGQ